MSNQSRVVVHSTTTHRARRHTATKKTSRTEVARLIHKMRFRYEDYILEFLEAIDSPRALGLWLRYKSGGFDSVSSVSWSPSDYESAISYYLDAQALALLSKYPYHKCTIDRELVAQKKFIEAERSCKVTNDRFRDRIDGRNLFPCHVESILSGAREKIAKILGPVPSYDRLDFKFGPGANFGVRGDTSVLRKITSDLECTYALAGILPEFLAEFPHWVDDLATVELVRGSQLAFVPKNAKTDRPICIEPMLNSLYQKGIGTFIRGRLARFGVNLKDQTINQGLAQLAYANGLATVDFSSASDTIAYHLVMDLLPVDWFDFLEIGRSPNYLFEDVWYPFQKFSSMGNAYTFELETLVFYAIACATCDYLQIPYGTQKNLHVYGDDVILPSAAYSLYAEVMSEIGFTINKEKSFSEGNFFESCGSDFFGGCLVRPFFIKDKIQSLKVYYAVNIISRFASRLSSIPNDLVFDQRRRGCFDRLLSLREKWIARMPIEARLRCPEGYGDGAISSFFDEATPTRPGKGWCGWVFAYAEDKGIPVRIESTPLAYALYFAGPLSAQVSQDYVPRGKTRVVVSRHFAFGEWRDPVNLRM